MTRRTRWLLDVAWLLALGCAPATPEPAAPAPPAAPASTAPPAPATETEPEPTPGSNGSAWVERSLAAIQVDTKGMRECPGDWTPEARAHFQKLYEQAHECVEQALASGRQVTGNMVFHSTLEQGGGLSEFAVLEDGVKDPELVQCIQQKAFVLEYPKVDPATPCVQFIHPLGF